MSTSAYAPLFSPRQADRWAQDIRNRVNSCLDCHLLELQKLTSEVVDLYSENVKWYHFIKLTANVVVLGYSLPPGEDRSWSRRSELRA
jgi:hypothetical protein